MSEHHQRRGRVAVSGDAIRKVRENAKWSREKLAAELGCSYKTVERIENGARQPSRATVVRLMLLFGVNLGDLGADLAALLPPSERP